MTGCLQKKAKGAAALGKESVQTELHLGHQDQNGDKVEEMSLLISLRHLLFPNPIVTCFSLIPVLVPVTYILSCIFFRLKIKGPKVGRSTGS